MAFWRSPSRTRSAHVPCTMPRCTIPQVLDVSNSRRCNLEILNDIIKSSISRTRANAASNASSEGLEILALERQSGVGTCLETFDALGAPLRANMRHTIRRMSISGVRDILHNCHFGTMLSSPCVWTTVSCQTVELFDARRDKSWSSNPRYFFRH